MYSLKIMYIFLRGLWTSDVIKFDWNCGHVTKIGHTHFPKNL